MKELNIPYIGVKIESLPTILEVLKTSKSNHAFIEYYVKLGKAPKTASEYLASLRNLKLAKRNSNGETEILKAGLNLLEDGIHRLYPSLLSHCIKHFPDLKIVRELAVKNQNISLNILVSLLNNAGYSIKRKQTLSSYLKLFVEGDKLIKKDKSVAIAHSYQYEQIEFNQFIKLLSFYSKRSNTKKIVLHDFYKAIISKYEMNRELFIKYLSIAKTTEKAKLYEINPKVLDNKDEAFEINSRFYFFIEII